MNIREETETDIESIWQLNKNAFATEVEANLVNEIRNCGVDYLSLVAELDNEVVGHIMFTPVTLSNSAGEIKIAGLAPMAVSKQYQNQGIGSKLVRTGLQRCQAMGYQAVVVLGHPGYYPKFGFKPSTQFGLKSEYDVPDDVFMVLELTPGILAQHSGTIKFHKVFGTV